MASCSSCSTAALALAVLVCAVTAFPSGGEEPQFDCDDECKEGMEKLKVMLNECMAESGCDKGESPKFYQVIRFTDVNKNTLKKSSDCSKDVPRSVQNFYACTAQKIGLLDDKRMVNMDVLTSIEQKIDEGCDKVAASGDQDETRKKICDSKEGIKAAIRNCVEEGRNEQKEDDGGVAATMAIRKCMCSYKTKGQ